MKFPHLPTFPPQRARSGLPTFPITPLPHHPTSPHPTPHTPHPTPHTHL
ncbi:hypothetical protein BFG60_1570 [Microcystis aeruginosa NIES-98]|nr:hypothetical protein BFG60_1570 [Microcystis aeruginosa NIES-98]